MNPFEAKCVAALTVVIILAIMLFVLTVPFPWSPGCNIAYSLFNRSKNGLYKLRHTLHHIPLDKDACHRNLRDFKRVMHTHGIPFWISEGTALGATREGDFIDHDDDVDVGVQSSHLLKFERHVIPELKAMKFTVDGVLMKGTFVLLSRSKEKIDVDFTGPGLECMSVENAERGKCHQLLPYLDDMSLVSIRDEAYMCPGVKYLEFLYGTDWMVPMTKDRRPIGSE